MKLGELTATLAMSGAVHEVIGPLDQDVRAVVCHTGRVVPGALFVAVRGAVADGHDYVADAFARGALAAVVEREGEVPPGKTAVVVENGRIALSSIAAEYYGNPSRNLVVCAVTGTNGKTTVSWILEGILRAAGYEVGVIGTVNYRFAGREYENQTTTPESVDLQRILREMADAGVTHVILEASSHGVDQHRVRDVALDVAVLTNFSQDHLDYHGDMDTYWASKRRLFTELLGAGAGKRAVAAVINRDDERGEALCRELSIPVLCAGLDEKAGIRAREASFGPDGIAAEIKTPAGDVAVSSRLVGRHNLYNIMCAVGVGVAMGVAPHLISTGVSRVEKIPGRLERVRNRAGKSVFVDYAHTPDALEQVLRTLREVFQHRIVCVFGCGGDRDRTKRPLMGEVAARYADLCIVTSDNPRTEDPDAIIRDILPGMAGTDFRVEPDRKKAIVEAVRNCGPTDVVLIAGKGHEDYQIVGREKHFFDDRIEAAKALDEPETGSEGSAGR